MKKVTVELGSRSYPVLIGEDLLRREDVLEPFTGEGQVLVVTNERVGPLYLDRRL
jgi:3-dehydroquinate synthase